MTKARQLDAIASVVKILRCLAEERTSDESPEDLRSRVNLLNHVIYLEGIVQTAIQEQKQRQARPPESRMPMRGSG